MRHSVEKPINFNALAPFELIAGGGGFNLIIRYREIGSPINLQKLKDLREAEIHKHYINEDFFVPIGMISGELGIDEIMAERRRVPRLEQKVEALYQCLIAGAPIIPVEEEGGE